MRIISDENNHDLKSRMLVDGNSLDVNGAGLFDDDVNVMATVLIMALMMMMMMDLMVTMMTMIVLMVAMMMMTVTCNKQQPGQASREPTG